MKLMDDYNYHDWSRFMVKEPKDKPTGSHFAAVLFETKREYSPSYDDRTSSEYYDKPVVTYFSFPDQALLREWVLRASKANMKFFFFEVKKLGSAELKVDIDVNV